MPGSGDILYSLPTLCDSQPALVDAQPRGDYRCLGEDDWRQIEFVERANLAHVQKELASLAVFMSEHWSEPGWTDVYMRREHPIPLSGIGLEFKILPSWPLAALAIGDEPWLVRGGFALAHGGDWFVYGERAENGHVVQLGVAPGREKPFAKFADAIVALTQSVDLLLVDWCSRTLVDTASRASVSNWMERLP